MTKIQLLLGAAAILGAANAAVIHRRDCSFTWTAETGDTCQSMANTWGISLDQFLRWNAGVECNALTVGRDYCLLWGDGPEPGAPTTTATPTSTTAKTSTTIALPATTTTTDPIGPSPTQEGIISSCQKYHLATAGDNCLNIVEMYGSFSLQEFYSWNPAVGDQCTGLWLGYNYCVGIKGTPATPTITKAPAPTGPTPVRDGTASDCERFHQVKSGDSCQGIVDKYRTFNLGQFYSWNPAVGTNCGSLWVDYWVCIGTKDTPTTAPPQPTTPSPVQPDVNPKCNNWYQVASGDYCQKIADQFKISLQTFYGWNPSVGSTCGSLWGGYFVCVGSS